jgi:hypothetical protein
MLRTVEHPRGIEEPAMLASTDGGVTREWGRQGCERRGARDGWYVGRWRGLHTNGANQGAGRHGVRDSLYVDERQSVGLWRRP